MSLIHIQNLKYSYDDAKLILNIQELSIPAGESVFLFGPSGSGKTTLLEILAGVIDAKKGAVSILGKNLSEMSATQKDQFRAQHIGYIFQQFNLVPYLTARENILLPLMWNSKKLNSELLNQLIESLGLQAIIDQKSDSLSVGQQQRVAAARALIASPEIILADEPTSALDYDHRENFLKILFALVKKQKSTLIFVSHDRSIQNLFERQINLQEISNI